MDLEPGVFCADMTQLIAAASHCRHPAKSSSLQLSYLTDPMAASAFEYICTVICNPTAVFFRRPKELVLADPVILAWQAAADEPLSKAVISLSDRKLASADEGDRNSVMAGAFAEWSVAPRYATVNGLTNSQLFARFVRFQLSQEDLMVQFWNNNRDEDMESAVATLTKSIPPDSLAAVHEAIMIERIEIDDISRRRWKANPKDFPGTGGL